MIFQIFGQNATLDNTLLRQNLPSLTPPLMAILAHCACTLYINNKHTYTTITTTTTTTTETLSHGDKQENTVRRHESRRQTGFSCLSP